MLAFVRDMGGESRNPIQDGKYGEVFLEDRVHFRAEWGNFRIPFCPTYPDYIDEGES